MSRRWGNVKVGGRPPAYFGYSESKPSSLKLWITSRTRSGDVKATFVIWVTSMPCADSNTICARRQVTTDPEDRRTILNSRLPSSLSISRTNSFSLIHRSKQAATPKWWTRPPNVAGQGTSLRAMSDPVVWFNPNCSKCRTTHSILSERGVDATYLDY